MAKFDILGKVVTITGDGEVGYGTDGKEALGVVSAIEERATYELMFDGLKDGGTFSLASATVSTLGLTGDWVVTVKWNSTFEGVPTNTTAPAVGDYVTVDGAGKLKTSATATNAKVISVNKSSKTATVKIS